MKSVALERVIGYLLKKFIEKTGETFQDSFNQSILDYVNILTHTCGDNPNLELSHIINNFEINVHVILKRMLESRQNYLLLRKQEAILSERKLPKRDNRKYMILPLSDVLYNGIDRLIHKYPNVFSNDRKATVKDVVDRSVLFRIIENDNIMQNKIYQEWRLKIMIKKESNAKLKLEEVIDMISRKRKVVWYGQ